MNGGEVRWTIVTIEIIILVQIIHQFHLEIKLYTALMVSRRMFRKRTR